MNYSQLKYLADKNGLTSSGTGGIGAVGPQALKGIKATQGHQER